MELLASLVNSLPSIYSSEFESLLFLTAFIMAFFAALRISELVAPRAGCQSGLQFSDVHYSAEQVEIFIRKSKEQIRLARVSV